MMSHSIVHLSRFSPAHHAVSPSIALIISFQFQNSPFPQIFRPKQLNSIIFSGFSFFLIFSGFPLSVTTGRATSCGLCGQWRSQKFANGDKTGGWGTEAPQRVPGAEPGRGLGRSPRSWRHTNDGGHEPMPPGYATVCGEKECSVRLIVCLSVYTAF